MEERGVAGRPLAKHAHGNWQGQGLLSLGEVDCLEFLREGVELDVGGTPFPLAKRRHHAYPVDGDETQGSLSARQ
jgi:hypothetical protein